MCHFWQKNAIWQPYPLIKKTLISITYATCDLAEYKQVLKLLFAISNINKMKLAVVD